VSYSDKVIWVRDRFKREENRVMIGEEIDKILKWAKEYDEIHSKAGSNREADRGSDSGVDRGSEASSSSSRSGTSRDDRREGCETGEDSKLEPPF